MAVVAEYPSRRALLVIAAILAVVALLGYLRDPPWLINVTSGFSRRWETDEEGTRYRWTRGHASFFVPADARSVVLPMRSVKDTPTDWPITATITIDGRPAQVITFDDESWRPLLLRLPRPGSRNTRRIDVTLNRVRSGQRGLQVQPFLIER